MRIRIPESRVPIVESHDPRGLRVASAGPCPPSSAQLGTRDASLGIRDAGLGTRNSPGTRDQGVGTRTSSPGYLLFEVLLALAILTIVVVLVFRIIQSTVRSTLDVTYLQTQEEKADGLFELFRQNFVSLPQLTAFQTRVHDGNTELIFRKAPFTFSWNNRGPQFGTIVLSARSRPDGRLAFCVLQEPEDATDSYVDGRSGSQPDWFPILSDLDQVSWRFYNASAGKWETDWPNPAVKPELVEITFKLSGDPRIQRGVFRWPVAKAAI
jgi:type II secretion system protein J